MHGALRKPRFLTFLAASLAIAAALRGAAPGASAAPSGTILPSGWVLSPPRGAEVPTGTMPQGMAPSPDGSMMAVVESGYNPAALALYRLPDLAHLATIALPGAFGRPLWLDASHVLVPGANADALLDVDVAAKSVARIAFPKGSYPVFVAAAPGSSTFAVACDGDGTVHLGTLEGVGRSAAIAIGGHPGGAAFSSDGKRVFVTVRSGSDVDAIDVASRTVTRVTTGLHPSAIAVAGDRLFVALTDADALGIFDASDLHSIATIPLGDTQPAEHVVGVSPNAISIADGEAFVSLGAANSVAVVRGDRLAGRVQAGWYPTDVAAAGEKLYVLDGKGEGARPNPEMNHQGDAGYVAAIEFGSLRAYDLPDALAAGGDPQGSLGWNAAFTSSVVRPNGPIRHVFFVLKENRTYDEILGDVRAGNGDPALAWFGAAVTPNEHAIAARFGLFDNAYANGEVSAPGHMWTDSAFSDDYMERFWPSNYGGRRDLDDNSVGAGGYIWQAARRAHVSFRDYGELADPGKTPASAWTPDVPSLDGAIDPHYAGWDLRYGDLDREREWQREFESMVRAGTLPAFEFIWLPNDHTYGSKAGELTPRSYIAENDDALGKMLDALSHSKVWGSSVMFVTEDDAQDGPDHVSDQRTTTFVASPYARGGVRHEHYSTVSILRTIELILGLQPLSPYDAMALPMTAAFTAAPNLRPYDAIPPKVPLTQRNAKTAYGAALSATMDFSRPDAAPDQALNDVLAHNH